MLNMRGKESEKTLLDLYRKGDRCLHYSNQTGHYLRGSFLRFEGFIERTFPGLNAKALEPQFIPVERSWDMRRHMPRYGVRDGKR